MVHIITIARTATRFAAQRREGARHPAPFHAYHTPQPRGGANPTVTSPCHEDNMTSPTTNQTDSDTENNNNVGTTEHAAANVTSSTTADNNVASPHWPANPALSK
jgi:hypothetical protein